MNLHVYQEGNSEIELNLLFRDYLRDHPDVRDAYASLKHDLLQQESSFQKQNSMFTGYNLGKDGFIRGVLKKAGLTSLRFVRATHYVEWEAAKKFRQEYFFDKVPVSDPYTWTFDHPDHVHFVLYQGVDIIGYAHIQQWHDQRVAMRIIVVDTARRRKGHGRQFPRWVEQWLKQKGYITLHVESSPAAVPFYEAAGYKEMPFNNPEGGETEPPDIPMAKEL